MPYQLQKRDVAFRNSAIRQGISRAIYDQMVKDPMVYILGEGSHMKVHYDSPYIEKEFSDRVITWPIAEDSGINFSLGASLLGVKPIFDVIVGDFMYRVMDSICNTVATTWEVSGKSIGPIIIRGETLLFAPSTGQRLEAFFAHTPNLNVVLPSNQYDAYWLMTDALNRKEVTVCYEDRMIQDSKMKEKDKLESDEWEPSKIGQAKLRYIGTKLTIVSYGLTLQRTEEILDANDDIDATLIDLMTLKPFDKKTIIDSAFETGNLLVIEPDIVPWGIGSEVVATVAEAASKQNKEVKVNRVGAPLRTIPSSPALHEYIIPNNERIEKAIKEALV